jgi:ERCC4-type nuclease
MSGIENEILFPRAILIDQREQSPYTFSGLLSDADEDRKPLRIITRAMKLQTGDYTLAGLVDEIAIERKSLEDTFGTIGQGRQRFVKELTRLSSLSYAAVVIEAELSTILKHPPAESQLPAKVVVRSIMHWQMRFPTVHFWMVPGRRAGEVIVFRLLEAFAKRWKQKS